MPFKQALEYLGRVSECSSYMPIQKESRVAVLPAKWPQQAADVLQKAVRRLERCPKAREALQRRGLNDHTMQKWELGFHTADTWYPADAWGLPPGKKIWVPKGWVIPWRDESGVIRRLKVRRSDWVDGESLPKYILLRGGEACAVLYGTIGEDLPIIIVESEFDAMLVVQEAGDLCQALALGGASVRPSQRQCLHLNRASLILYSLDWDDAGKRQFSWWRARFQRIRAWLSGMGKSPGDGRSVGMDIRRWILDGLMGCETAFSVDLASILAAMNNATAY